ncbi:hypothetical protein L208DRAFT_1236984 [Tricholoma matsutake]|nr:hypothetical protein L208DRAFT_1236984 [Tricholoma matsutake 945]
MSTFWTYTTPSTSVAYSSQFFRSLTFNQIVGCTYPSFLLPNTVTTWMFTDEVPTMARSTIILFDEVIPDIADLNPIMRSLEDEYNNGQHSVVLVFHDQYSDVTTEHLCHFSKLQLFVNLNNYQIPQDYACWLVTHLTSEPCFSPLLVAKFCEFKIASCIAGFCVTDFPLWKLGCFLDENWLGEDLVNGLLELLYFRLATTSFQSHSPFIFLPTSFSNNAKHLYNQSPRLYSPNLIALQNRICVATPCAIFAIACIDDHYSAYCSEKNKMCIEHRDSLEFPPVTEVLPILQWVLSGLNIDYYVPGKVIKGELSKQGQTSGCCEIAAENFIASHADPSIPAWSNALSSVFRNLALRNMLVYHCAALGKGVHVFHLCKLHHLTSSSVVYQLGGSMISYLSNMQARHPIYQFLASLQDEPRIDFQAIKAHIKSQPSSELIDLSFSSPPAPIKQAPKNVIDLVSPLKPTHKPAHVKSPSPDVIILGPPAKHVKNKPVLTLPMTSGPLLLNINLKSAPVDDVKNTLNRATPQMLGQVLMGSVYNSMEAARDVVYAQEKKLGHTWQMGQSKCSPDGAIKKVTLCCNHYYHHIPSHLASIDPSDHRQGKTIKTECFAHVNVNHMQGGLWHITTVAWEHNHQQEVPVGGIVSCPPTQAQHELVAKISDPTFSRGTLKTILAEHFPTHILEPRQITNLLNDA